jgi:hypothetical protein
LHRSSAVTAKFQRLVPIVFFKPSRINNGTAITTNQQQYVKENSAQKGPSLTQNANIRTLINDPSYNLVRIKQPPEHINDKIAFTFNNLSFSNLSQKAQELK